MNHETISRESSTTTRDLEAREPDALRDSTPAEIALAAEAAAGVFDEYRSIPLADRALFLEAIADEIESVAPLAIESASLETGLPTARLTGEIGRTTGQLRLFARTVRDGLWQGVRIDHADESRSPARRPDIRLRRIPLGPVAVFAASNFPFAFSVAGGDTASALAAGCPVVVKAHEGHPRTSAIVAGAIARAARGTGMPQAVFSMVQGTAHRVGLELVAHPAIAAVGFTGSRQGGLALVAAAARREVPIPVFAEMSAVNPVFLLPARIATDPAGLASGFAASLTLGSGQYCTNPGLVFVIGAEAATEFAGHAASAIAEIPAAPMLSERMTMNFATKVAELTAHPAVRRVTPASNEPTGPALFATDADALLQFPELQDEVFGAAGLIVTVADGAEMLGLVPRLGGQLTATIHAADADLALARRLLPALERLAGRILFDGWPTGVEVVPAMVHGGPFPATSDSRSTSVGTLAIDRFLRPVSYQDVPPALLPVELRDGEGSVDS